MSESPDAIVLINEEDQNDAVCEDNINDKSSINSISDIKETTSHQSVSKSSTNDEHQNSIENNIQQSNDSKSIERETQSTFTFPSDFQPEAKSTNSPFENQSNSSLNWLFANHITDTHNQSKSDQQKESNDNKGTPDIFFFGEFTDQFTNHASELHKNEFNAETPNTQSNEKESNDSQQFEFPSNAFHEAELKQSQLESKNSLASLNGMFLNNSSTPKESPQTDFGFADISFNDKQTKTEENTTTKEINEENHQETNQSSPNEDIEINFEEKKETNETVEGEKKEIHEETNQPSPNEDIETNVEEQKEFTETAEEERKENFQETNQSPADGDVEITESNDSDKETKAKSNETVEKEKNELNENIEGDKKSDENIKGTDNANGSNEGQANDAFSFFTFQDSQTNSNAGFCFDFNQGFVDKSGAFVFSFPDPGLTTTTNNFSFSSQETNVETSPPIDQGTFHPFPSNSNLPVSSKKEQKDNPTTHMVQPVQNQEINENDFCHLLNAPIFASQKLETPAAYFLKKDADDSIDAAYQVLFEGLRR